MHYIPNSVEYEEESPESDSDSRSRSSSTKKPGSVKKLKNIVKNVVQPFGASVKRSPRHPGHVSSATSPTNYGATEQNLPSPTATSTTSGGAWTPSGRLPPNSTLPLSGSNPTTSSSSDVEKPTVTFEIPLSDRQSDREGSDFVSTIDDEASRQQWRKEEMDKLKSSASISVTHCVLAILAYVAISVVLFSFFFEKWSILNSAYFAVVTFTTIGYGDLVPDSAQSRIFTCLWALSGVACLGVALGVLGSNLIEVHEKESHQLKTGLRNQVIDIFEESKKVRRRNIPRSDTGGIVFSTLEEGRRRGMYDHIEDDHEPNYFKTNTWHFRNHRPGCWKQLTSRKALRTMFLLSLFGVLLYYIMLSEGWTIYSTLYYALITASTVGYGDIAPKTEQGRLLAIVFIPFAVGVMGTVLETVASTIIEGRRRRFRDYFNKKPLTYEDIALLDVNGDGNVTRAEFLECMLVTLDLVDKDLLDQLNEHFDQLDNDGNGTINKDDLASAARSNMQGSAGG